ncbi:MAG: response regulator [Oscillochloris sp.]|nr:response regulator [Oscillochloris sp.]
MHTILIVDDEPDLCWALEHILQSKETRITTVGCGNEALALVQDQDYTVAFIDVILPDVNGLHLAKQIHRLTPDTAIVLMSGYYYREDTNLAGVPLAGFLSKPFLISDVFAIL